MMNLMITLMAAFLLVTGSLSGLVINESGSPLPGAHIITDVEMATVSNQEGRFELKNLPEGNVSVTVSMVGYRRHTQEIEIVSGQHEEIVIVLESITISSGEILVTAGRRTQVAGNVPVSMARISSADIEFRNQISLDQTLRYVPGVQMTENQVNIRGSSGFSYGAGSRVLLLVDGVPMMGPDQGDIKLDAMPMAQVERIEIVKGPGSAMYGSGALGGVINLITKDFPEQPKTEIRGYQGFYQPAVYEIWKKEWANADQFRPYNGGVISHAQKIGDRFGFWINGMFKQDMGYLERSSVTGFQVYSKVGYRPTDKTRLNVFGGIRQNRQRQFLYWNGQNDPLRTGRINFGGREASGGNFVQAEHYSILPEFTHFVNNELFYTIRARGYGIAVRPIDRQGNIRPKDQHTIGFRYGSEAQVNWIPNQNNSLVAGISYDDIVAESEFFIGQDSMMLRNQPEYAAFAQYDRDISRQLAVSIGLRYDAYHIDTQDVASRLSPKLNAAYNISEAFTVRAAWGLGFRVPGVAERFVNNRDFLPLESNLDLRPEESIGYELGKNYVFRFGKSAGMEWDSALFWNDYNYMVEPKFVPELAAFQFINLTEARIRGFETTLQAYLDGGRHRISLGYTYLDHEDITENTPLVFRSTHQIVTGAQGSLPFGFMLGVDYRFLSKPDRVDSDFSRFVPEADAFVDIHVLDARVHKQWNSVWRNLDIRLSADVKNVLNYYYVERPAYLAEPRSYMMSLGLSF